jgi:hypothetical protein
MKTITNSDRHVKLMFTETWAMLTEENACLIMILQLPAT